MMTAREAADRLGVSLSLVYRLCRELVLPHQRIGTGKLRGIRIKEADVEHWRQLCLLDAARLLPCHFFNFPPGCSRHT